MSTTDWGYYRIGGETASLPPVRFVLFGMEMVTDKAGTGFAHEKDARLMASAPDMAVALKNGADALSFLLGCMPDDEPFKVKVAATERAARETLAKAEGHSDAR